MTVDVKVPLPEDVAKEAEEQGLLKPEAMEAMLRERMRERRVERLFENMDKLSQLRPPVTEAEIADEIRAARAERRRLDADRR